MTGRPRPSVTPACLSAADTATYLGVSRATIYRLTAACGTTGFPRPVPTGSRRVFQVRDLDAWLSRAAASDARPHLTRARGGGG